MNDNKDQLIVINNSVLPPIYLKVLKAKYLIKTKQVASSAEAARTVGISRTAFYKYKNCVFEYHEKFSSKIISINVVLIDKKGVLSALINAMYVSGANILTINQSIPVNGVAAVAVSIRTNEIKYELSRLIYELESIDGVVSIEQLKGDV